MASVSSLISLLSLCMADLSIGGSGVLKPPTNSVKGLMWDLNFSNISFTNVVALVLGT